MKAMVFAAGLGSRLKPLTDNKPKALVEVKGIPMLEIVIRRLEHFGFNEIVVNVHHFSEQIIEFLNKPIFKSKIYISDESDCLLDTGGGLKKAAKFFDTKPVLIHNVDVISNLNLSDFYQQHVESNALATLAVKNRKTSRYFLFDNNGQMIGWKNMKTSEIRMSRVGLGKLNALAFSGIHIVNPKIFNLMKQEGKFSITDTYLELSRTQKIIGYQCESSMWMDLGNSDNLAKAEEFFRDRKLPEFLLQY
jgi:NDP-sugar pyrophosphorylase family protein